MSTVPRIGRPRLGILGGMGPAATIAFQQRLLRLRHAARDQDHVPYLLSCNSRVPDRTAAIVGNGQSPLPELRRDLQTLLDSGADVIAMPHNTAHHWWNKLAAEGGSARLLHIVDAVTARLPSDARPGLLATTGTLRAGIYAQRAGAYTFMAPPETTQEEVMAAIAAIKSGKAAAARGPLHTAACRLRDGGATHIVMACTEVPLVLDPEDNPDLHLVDSLSALAAAAIAALDFQVHEMA